MRNDRLKDYRVKRNFTQESLAFELQTDKRQITRWENGESDPSANRLIDLARVLQVSVDYLLGVSDDPAPQVRVDNLSEDEKAILKALRSGNDKEAMKIIANR